MEKAPKPKAQPPISLSMPKVRGIDIAMGRFPAPEIKVHPTIKKIAKGLGDAAVFGWTHPDRQQRR